MGRKINGFAQIVDDEGKNKDERGRNYNVADETILIDITIIS